MKVQRGAGAGFVSTLGQIEKKQRLVKKDESK